MSLRQDFIDNLNVVLTWDHLRNKYINGPAGITQIMNGNLKEAVCRIGKTHGKGFGSDQAKGIRYISGKTGASKTAVKVLLKSIRNFLSPTDGLYDDRYVLKIHKEHLVPIFMTIMEAMDKDNEFKKNSMTVAAGGTYSDYLLYDHKISLSCIELRGTNEGAREIANRLLSDIRNKDQKP